MRRISKNIWHYGMIDKEVIEEANIKLRGFNFNSKMQQYGFYNESLILKDRRFNGITLVEQLIERTNIVSSSEVTLRWHYIPIINPQAIDWLSEAKHWHCDGRPPLPALTISSHYQTEFKTDKGIYRPRHGAVIISKARHRINKKNYTLNFHNREIRFFLRIFCLFEQ